MADINKDGRIDLGGVNPPVPGRQYQGVMETFDTNWWRDNYSSLPNVRADRGFEHYEPALRYGWDAASRHRGRQWSDVEGDLSRGWSERQGATDSRWDDMKHTVRHAFDRAMHVFEGARDPDARR